MLRRAILVAFLLVPIALIVLFLFPQQDLEPATAASIMSSTPEFQGAGSLVNVTYTFSQNDSLGPHSYAYFTFREGGAGMPVRAKGGFEYWNRRWHLRSFEYGNPPDMKTVVVTSERPPSEQLHK